MNPLAFSSASRLLHAATAVAMALGSAVLADTLPVRDAATVALLEQLQERDMPDVMLWVLDRVAADPKASADLKKQLPFRRASALVATTRTELDAAKRAAILDEAEKEIDRFLVTGPEGRPAISWGVVVAVGLLLAGVPMLLFNQQHSGDPLKVRRELRKF